MTTNEDRKWAVTTAIERLARIGEGAAVHLLGHDDAAVRSSNWRRQSATPWLQNTVGA